MLTYYAMTIDTGIVYSLLYVSLYFEVFLLISFISHKNKTACETPEGLPQRMRGYVSQTQNAWKAKLPTVTITVPCYNEEKTLAKTVRSLLALDYPANKLSICIVNDGSTDDTLKIAHEFENLGAPSLSLGQTLGPLNTPTITVLDKENGGKASAMNLALSKSKSELIGCLDADSFVSSNALMLIAKQFMGDKNISAVTPAIMIHNPKNILQMMQRAEYMIGIFMRKVFSMMDSVVVTPGPFSIFRRADILKVGPWKHGHGTEDFEMGLRLQSLHKKIANEPLAQVMTISPDTLYRLYLQRIRWVYGFLMNAWDYKYMIGNMNYGNVGMFVLPTALVSVFGAVYMFAVVIINIITSIADLLIRIYTIGINFSLPSIELFYINTNAMLFIVIVLIAMILLILHNSAQLADTKVHKKDTVLYLLLYGLVAPLWLTGAVARAVVGKESKWRVIR